MKGRMGDNARIHHILECINKIESAISGFTYEDFERNDIYRTAVVKWLEIIGEAARYITDETKEKHPDIEWASNISFRNVVVHQYFAINYKIVWDVASIFLKELKTKIESINLD